MPAKNNQTRSTKNRPKSSTNDNRKTSTRNRQKKSSKSNQTTSTNNNQNLYLNNHIIRINDTKILEELKNDILEIVVDESLHRPSMFTIKVHNVEVAASEDSEPWKNEKYFNIGDRISIGFEASTTEDIDFQEPEIEERLIEGEITGTEVKFAKRSQAHIIVRGYDVSHRLHRGRYNRSFLNCTDTDIVRQVAQEANIKIGQLDASSLVHEYVFQENQTNIEFLRERAAKIGFELFVQNNKIHFRKPISDGSLVLEWLKEIKRFDVRVTSDEQVSSVQVNSWDYSQKMPISETVLKEQSVITVTGNGSGSSIAQKFTKQPPKMIVVDRPVDTVSKAKQIAQGLCDELGGEFVNADAKAEGNPNIRPGKVVELTKLGTRYSGTYYITGTYHHYIKGNYTTNFTVRGLREGSLLSTLPPKIPLQPGQTLLVGLVTNNKDPKGLGRVKVKFPTLTMDHESHWARVVGLGAGNSRGFYCLPEVDDEVLVGFEHGDIHRPYIVGGVWNGKDKTVATVDNTVKNGNVNVRSIKTRTGHEIKFVEENNGKSKAGIYITSKDKQKVHINDGDDCIDIKTSGKINLNAQGEIISGFESPSAIDIEGKLPVNISSSVGGINISSAVGPINIQSTATGPITISSPLSGMNLVSGSYITMMAPVINLAAPLINTMGIPAPNPAAITPASAAASAAAGFSIPANKPT